MNDTQFLHWIADRFVNIHGESPNVDFVQRLRQIADFGPQHEHDVNECRACWQVDDSAYCRGQASCYHD